MSWSKRVFTNKWIEFSLENTPETKRMVLLRFWTFFYKKYVDQLKDKTKEIINGEDGTKNEDSSLNQDDSTREDSSLNKDDCPREEDSRKTQEESAHNDSTKKAKKTTKKSDKKKRGITKSEQYKQEVFDILHDAKKRFPLSEEEFKNLQIKIEDKTMLFDEESMFKTAPNIIKILIKHDKDNAKDYLKRKLHGMDSIDEILSEFGQYTIEALIVHVLGMLFNNEESK